MIQDVSPPATEDDPIMRALANPDVLTHLGKAIYARLAKSNRFRTGIERHSEVQSIVQKVCIRAMQARDRFDTTKSVVAWLIGIAFNIIRETVKKRHLPRTDLTRDSVRLEELVRDPAPPVDKVVADKLDAHQMLDKLSPEDQDLIRLRMNDLTFAEIGQKIGLSEGCARVRYSRLLKELKSLAREAQS